MIGDMKQDVESAIGNIEPQKWSTEKIRNHVRKRLSWTDIYFYLVVDIGEDIIGVIEVKFKTNKCLYLSKGFVEPPFRKQGIMKMLEDQLVCIARTRGVKEIELKVKESNKPGVKTWTCLGYKREEVIEKKGYKSLLVKKVIDAN